MKIYGADFSGARDPGLGIWYAEGELRKEAPGGPALRIVKVVHCDDRLDLFEAIRGSQAPWGLDFPFSFPTDAQNRLGINSWSALLKLAEGMDRAGFARLLEDAALSSCEARCTGSSPCCRLTDTAVSAFSPLKKTNPNMRVMTWAGLKLLAYLRRSGCSVYPFDAPVPGASLLFEVYPSHTWQLTGLKRNPDLTRFSQRFSSRFKLTLEAEAEILNQVSQDAADAIVACITMAYSAGLYGLDGEWNRRPSWIGEDEWDCRYEEGLVVRIDA
jgi:hypothetical protein